MRRIVVTGMGAVSPLGDSAESSWGRLLAGQSGLRRLSDDVVGDLPAKVGGVVPSLEEDAEAGFDPDQVLPPKDQRKMDRFIMFALAAADEALIQAGWRPVSEEDRQRTATIIASGGVTLSLPSGLIVPSPHLSSCASGNFPCLECFEAVVTDCLCCSAAIRN